MILSEDHKGLSLGLIAVIIFGTTLPATRAALVAFDPLLVGIGRTFIAAFVAVVLLLVTKQRWPRRAHAPWLVLTAAGVVIGFPLFSAMAMQSAPATHGGVVLGILPLTTALAAALIAGERPSKGFWVCAFLGSALVVLFALWEGDIALYAADLWLILAIVSVSIGYAAGGVLSRILGGWQVICWALVFALPVSIPVTLYLVPSIDWHAPATAWTGLLYVALCSQLIGFFAWNRGMVLSGIARIGQLQLLQPFVTLAGSALLISEQITLVQIVFAFAVVGVVAIGRKMPVRQQGH